MKSSLLRKAGILAGFTGLRAAGLFVILLVAQLNLNGQTTVYIDPTNTNPSQNGTITNPYSSWNQVSWINGNTYLQKRGTTFNTTGNVAFMDKNNITLGAYGTGERPRIISSGGSGLKVVRLTGSSNCTVRDLEVSSTGSATSAVIIEAYLPAVAANNLIDNCLLHGCEWGVRIVTQAPGNRILNTTIHNIGDDGIYVKDVNDIEIGYCHVYNINTKYFVDPNQTYSPGDCIQLVSLYDLYYNIHHNILDHSTTGNKFCFISAGETYTGLIEYNTMIGNSGAVTTCIYLGHTSGTVMVRNNTLQDGNYAIYSYATDLQLQYNKISRNNQGISVMSNHNLTALNNVFYNNSNNCIGSGTNTIVTSRNNVFHLGGGNSRVYSCNSTVISNYNDFNTQQTSFLNGHSTLASWQTASGNDLNSFVANPVFVNPAINDFCLQSTSPCINTGTNVGLTSDFFGTQVPQAGFPDVGIHEVVSTQGNQAPVMANQTFSIAENSANGVVVGTVVASDPDAGQLLTFSITAGNTGNAFAINPSSGALSVANSSALNFETTPVFQLSVRVQDNGTPVMNATAIAQVNISNINELPVITNQGFVIASNSPNGTVAGTVAASDPDLNQALSYSIIAGNTGTAFAINASTGVISVANSTAVNYLTNPLFSLTVRVQDNGSPVLASSATVAITVTPVNNAPVISTQSFSVNENSPQGTAVGQLTASDPDPGQTLSYTILSGNTGSTFQLSTSGQITVANPQLLNFESAQSFLLLVQVTDNGIPPLASSTNVTITLNNVNENPVVAASQAFAVAEHVQTGTQVGAVLASDPDAGQTLSYSIVSGNTNNAFAISASTGAITVAGSICFEVCNQYSLMTRASDNGNPSLSDQEIVIINLTNVNENPVINNQSFQVDSYSPAGTIAGVVAASDPDANQALSFSITAGNTSNAFGINASTGALTVANSSAINYITNPLFNLTIGVQDNGIPVLTSTATITVTIVPVNGAPVIANQAFSLNENLPAGVIAGQVIASDPDPGQSLTYAITSGNTAGAFQIGGNGILSIAYAAAINFESNPVFQLSIAVTDNGQPQMSASATVVVSLIDVNETPAFGDNTNFSVNEHAVIGTSVGTISATDQDAGQNISYSLVAGNTNNAFAISASTGNITVANNNCFEICSQYSLQVRATDNGTPVLWSDVTSLIQLNDINERPVIAAQGFTSAPFAPNGTIIGIVEASDPDFNQALSFSIVSGNSAGAFAINASTGSLTVANSAALNPADSPVFTLVVKAQDNGIPTLSSTAGVTITLDTQNSAPVIVTQAFSANENLPAGSIIGTVSATDPNLGQSLMFSIESGNTNSAFAISAAGVLSISNSAALDFESTPAYTLTIRVTDNGSPALWAQAPVTISVNDMNDPPTLLPQTFSIKENSPNGRYVCTVISTDQDPGDTHQSYIMAGNTNNAFKMQAYTSRIFVNSAAALNFEATPVFHLTIRSVDNHGGYSEQVITINLLDVNEAPVVLNQSFSVARSAPNGTVVGAVNASDQDFGQTLSYTITLGNTSGIFAINLNSGVITVVNAAALNKSNISAFILTVKVRDNGSPVLYSNGYMTVTVIRTKDGESFEVAENQASERLNLSLTVYPNPSSDGIFHIKLNEEVTESTILTITDLTGKILAVENAGSDLNQRIDLGYLPAGIYLMHAKNAEKQSVSKLIKQ